MWFATRRARKYGRLAGFGPISDGIPCRIGRERPELPDRPPRHSYRIVEIDDTVPNRKADLHA